MEVSQNLTVNFKKTKRGQCVEENRGRCVEVYGARLSPGGGDAPVEGKRDAH